MQGLARHHGHDNTEASQRTTSHFGSVVACRNFRRTVITRLIGTARHPSAIRHRHHRGGSRKDRHEYKDDRRENADQSRCEGYAHTTKIGRFRDMSKSGVVRLISTAMRLRYDPPKLSQRHARKAPLRRGFFLRGHMKPGLRGRYCAQFPKSRVDTRTIGSVMRIPRSAAILRAISLVPGRNAEICDEPLFAAKCNAVSNAAPRSFGWTTPSGPI
jgi:hypothetical protein